MKILLIILTWASILQASEGLPVKGICVLIPNTCASHGEILGCEGGYKQYPALRLDYYSSQMVEKNVAYRQCLEKLNDLGSIEKALHCREIKDTCASHGELPGCEGGYELLELDTQSTKYFPVHEHRDALKACLK